MHKLFPIVLHFLAALAIVISKTGLLRIRFQPHFYLALLKQSFPFALLIPAHGGL